MYSQWIYIKIDNVWLTPWGAHRRGRELLGGKSDERMSSMRDETFIEQVLPAQKRIALIAHDNMKPEIIDWCQKNREVLSGHFLCGTGTTARMIADRTGLPVYGYNSGPLGGDQQVGAQIVEGKIDLVIFFSDPLTAQPHDPDVKALLRIAQVYDIPIANNRATADFLISSPLMNRTYTHYVTDFKQAVSKRAATL